MSLMGTTSEAPQLPPVSMVMVAPLLILLGGTISPPMLIDSTIVPPPGVKPLPMMARLW
jgi:hypothetical protein